MPRSKHFNTRTACLEKVLSHTKVSNTGEHSQDMQLETPRPPFLRKIIYLMYKIITEWHSGSWYLPAVLFVCFWRKPHLHLWKDFSGNKSITVELCKWTIPQAYIPKYIMKCFLFFVFLLFNLIHSIYYEMQHLISSFAGCSVKKHGYVWTETSSQFYHMTELGFSQERKKKM